MPNESTCLLGIDLGGTKILAGVIDTEGRVIARAKQKTMSEVGYDDVFERVVQTAGQALENAEMDLKQVRAAGIGAPGPRDVERGIILESPNLGWKNAPLGPDLERALGCPAFLYNDVNAGTWGEFALSPVPRRSMMGVFVGTGIGGGLVLDGRMHEGATLNAGEIGHMAMERRKGPQCGCGRRGCFEALASRTAMTRDIWAEIDKGRKSVLADMVEEKGGRLRSKLLRKAWEAEDKVARRVLGRAAETIGRMLGSVANLLDIEAFVLGGGVLTALGEDYLALIREAFDEQAFANIAENTTLELARLGDDAGIIGAALLARDELD